MLKAADCVTPVCGAERSFPFPWAIEKKITRRLVSWNRKCGILVPVWYVFALCVSLTRRRDIALFCNRTSLSGEASCKSTPPLQTPTMSNDTPMPSVKASFPPRASSSPPDTVETTSSESVWSLRKIYDFFLNAACSIIRLLMPEFTRCNFVGHRPTSELYSGLVKFHISSTVAQFIDLRRSRLNIKAKIVNKDASSLKPGHLPRISFISASAACFSHMDVYLQQETVSGSDDGKTYRYKDKDT